MLRIGGDLQETEPGGVIGQFFEAPATVRSLVEALRKAKVDRRISSVIVRPSGAAALWGKVQEIRDAIIDFKTSGKPIVAYLEYGGEQEFYLASACDKVFLMPTRVARPDRHGDLRAVPARHARQDRRLSGHAAHRRVQDRVQHVHREDLHAGAPRDGASRSTATCTSSWFAASPTAARRSETDMRGADRRRPVPARGRASAPGSWTMWRTRMSSTTRCKLGERRRATFVDRGGLPRASAPTSLGLNRGPRIAVIYASGMIASGQSSYDSPSGQVVGSDTMIEYMRKARADDVDQGDRPAHRQPRRIGDRVGRRSGAS